jgi:UDP-N-acetylmuramate dehydrogenase
MKILENVALKEYTTFRLGGPARFLIEAESEKDIEEALKFAQNKKLPYFILGRGSNIIFSDAGFGGVIIKLNWSKCDFDQDRVFVGAAVLLDRLVDLCLEKRLLGLEWAAGIPGTVGGAIWGNAGANGGEMKDIVSRVKIIKQGRIEWIENKDCKFGYRDSIFKQKKWVILGAEVKLSKAPRTSYRRGRQSIEFSKKLVENYRKARIEKHPLEYPSAGSIFRNVPLVEVQPLLLEKFKDAIKNDPFPVVPAAKIVAEAGLAGEKNGDAQVSKKHTNFIVNLGQAKSSDVLELIEKVKSIVKEKFGIQLNVEPIIVDYKDQN